MPKDRRMNSFSFNRPNASPYACSSKNSDLESQKSLPPVGNEREWEEAMCPICMEHPHNAVLLLCSSQDKGCRPYMCDTSYRHSNCFDQFCKSSAVGAQREGDNISGSAYRRGSWGRALSGAPRSHVQQQPELVCPLCRGHVKGWIVVEAARNFMNSKTRSCALETCNFTGNYVELRKHARSEHPSERPSEADPSRQSDWTRLELQRDFEDVFSAYQAPFGDDFPGYDFLTELPLDDGQFDLLDGYLEAEEVLNEDINVLLDFEFELSFSFLNEFSLVPSAWEWDEFPSYAGGSAYQSASSSRSQNRGSRRSASRSNNHEARPTATRSTNLSWRPRPSSFRERRRNR
ncbi:PREDICTED: uncharacterized protein LOC109212471 [Nicotiana attenuata]|uniref:Uncharacterized protein n=1 Tax=Nicotiana attenuata TaxID=49451 RepID=A0A314KGS5_NICAT|nr:PREDICTED: uncharacterized protein LOC109212471 [Nicotiana attenuata]OIT28571.1 hypothetical protein A4A49_27300 [Nicotiana attenuata]